MKSRDISWLKYLIYGTGHRISLLGERWNIPFLIYNPLHFIHYYEIAKLNAPGVISGLLKVFPDAVQFADIGAGSGGYARELLRCGKTVVACEHNFFGRVLARAQGVDCRPFNLLCKPPATFRERFDVVYCFEVAEHLPEQLALCLADFLASLAPTVVFSAAQPGQQGTGHINLQPKEYWRSVFEKRGYQFDSDRTSNLASHWSDINLQAHWMINNIQVFILVAGGSAKVD